MKVFISIEVSQAYRLLWYDIYIYILININAKLHSTNIFSSKYLQISTVIHDILL